MEKVSSLISYKPIFRSCGKLIMKIVKGEIEI